jgi:hypothetical protein
MKARTIVFALAMCLVGAAVCFAQDANLGTWKLNEAKSNLAKGAPKNSTVVYEAVGVNVKSPLIASEAMAGQCTTSGQANTTAKTTR